MKIKKMIFAALTMAFCLVGTTTAFAAGISADEQAILDKLKAGVTVDGKTVTVPADIINQVQNEFAKNETDVTAAQASVINAKMDEVTAIVKADKLTTVDQLKAEADKLVPIVKAAAAEIDYTVAWDTSAQNFSVTDPSGDTVYTSKEVVNQTGFDLSTTVAVGALIVTLLAACLVVASKKNLFAKANEA